jgi:hypothetical protein
MRQFGQGGRCGDARKRGNARRIGPRPVEAAPAADSAASAAPTTTEGVAAAAGQAAADVAAAAAAAGADISPTPSASPAKKP